MFDIRWASLPAWLHKTPDPPAPAPAPEAPNAHTSAAIDQPDAALREKHTCFIREPDVTRIIPWTRTAINCK